MNIALAVHLWPRNNSAAKALGDKRGNISPMRPQAVGAYGEKMVEAELLRRGWLPANVNATVKNAAEFDNTSTLKRTGGSFVCG